MTDRSAPAHALSGYVAELEAELESALQACPQRQRFEVEALRKRVALARVGTISRSTFAPTVTTSRTRMSMTDALYDDLRDAVRTVCVQLDPLPHESTPLGVAWHPWARAFIAGVYSRKTTTRALEAARPEAPLDGATNAVAVLSRVAASAAATAVLNAIDGDEARAQEIARETRVIADLLASQLKTSHTQGQDEDRTTPRSMVVLSERRAERGR
jgi:hypothetical protein